MRTSEVMSAFGAVLRNTVVFVMASFPFAVYSPSVQLPGPFPLSSPACADKKRPLSLFCGWLAETLYPYSYPYSFPCLRAGRRLSRR